MQDLLGICREYDLWAELAPVLLTWKEEGGRQPIGKNTC